MRFQTPFALAALVTLFGCSSPDSATEAVTSEAPASTTSESGLTGGGTECVVDTLFMKKGFLADLVASVDPSFIKDYGAQYYKHVEIPGTLDAALPTTTELGEAFYTIHGFDYGPEQLAAGATAKPRNVATIGGSPVVDAKLTFAKSRYVAAHALFDALTRANEATANHVVPPAQVYDRSWTKVTRRSPAGRIVCEQTTYPGTTATDYTCTIADVERNMIQAYNTTGTNGHCPTH